MNILLLGGTGAMGRNLSQILVSQGNSVTVTSRSKSGSENNLHYVLGNAKDLYFLHFLLQKQQWDAVVDFMVYSPCEFTERYHKLLASTKQYVFFSSSRVYADCKEKITEKSPRLLDKTEDQEYLQTDEYALAKAREENLLFKSERKNWTIIRPYITFDTYRLQLGVMEKEYWLYRALHGRSIVFSKDIAEHITTMTSGYDVATGIASVIGNKNAFGEAYHITASESHAWQEICSVYQDVLNTKVVMTDKSPMLKMAKYQIMYDRYFDRRFDNSKILSMMGMYDFSPALTALRNSLISFMEKPVFLDINWKMEATFDRITGELASWSELKNRKNRFIYYAYRFCGERLSEKIIFRALRIVKGLKHG